MARWQVPITGLYILRGDAILVAGSIPPPSVLPLTISRRSDHQASVESSNVQVRQSPDTRSPCVFRRCRSPIPTHADYPGEAWVHVAALGGRVSGLEWVFVESGRILGGVGVGEGFRTASTAGFSGLWRRRTSRLRAAVRGVRPAVGPRHFRVGDMDGKQSGDDSRRHPQATAADFASFAVTVDVVLMTILRGRSSDLPRSVQRQSR